MIGYVITQDFHLQEYINNGLRYNRFYLHSDMYNMYIGYWEVGEVENFWMVNPH